MTTEQINTRPVALEGTRLSVARRRRGMKQSELAKKLGVPEKTIKAWEDKTEWCEDKEIVLKLAFMLQFPVQFFYQPEIELIDANQVSFRSVDNDSIAADQPTQPRQITVTIVRTFTPADDPFGLFGLLTEAGNLSGAVSELRYDVLYVEDNERQLMAVGNLLNGAEWKVEPC